MDKELFGFIIAVLGILTGSGALRIIQVLLSYRKGVKLDTATQLKELSNKLEKREEEIRKLLRLNGELLAEVKSLRTEVKYLREKVEEQH